MIVHKRGKEIIIKVLTEARLKILDIKRLTKKFPAKCITPEGRFLTENVDI